MLNHKLKPWKDGETRTVERLPVQSELRAASAVEIAHEVTYLHSKDTHITGPALFEINRFFAEAALELSYKVLNATI